MNTLFYAHDYGARGAASPAENLSLVRLRYKWLQFPPGVTATIYHKKEQEDFDSTGIQRAIDAAHDAGGGTVHISAGDYLIKPISLRSRVRLHLESGANLWGSPELEHYDRPGGRRPLIETCDAEDVSITGQGQISGQSPKWAIPWLNSNPTDWKTQNRPTNVLLFKNCRDVTLEGVLVKDSATWSVVCKGCDGVRIEGLRIETFDNINCDGIDLAETSNATISNCRIHTTDDGIVLKNFRPDHTMRNITVSNCVIRTLCNGLKIGTESVGNFDNITFANCVVHNPDTDIKRAEGGLNICAVDGGTVSNVSVSNIVMRNVDCPFYMVTSTRERFQAEFRTPRSGRIERVTISNILADGARFTSFAVGTPEQAARDIHFSNIRIRKTHDFREGPNTSPVPACGNQYPNPFMFASPDGGRQGLGDGLPAFGLYLRHAEGVTVRDFVVECTQHDGRPLVVEEECGEITLANVTARNNPSRADQCAAPIRGILFDMDGVLIDSEPVHEHSVRALIERLGGDASGLDLTALKGVTEPAVAQKVREMFPQFTHSVADIVTLKVGIYEEMFERVPLIEGAKEFAHRARAAGYRMGLATSAVRSSQMLTFETFQLAECFEAITTGEDVEHSKPHPEPYLRTAALLGLHPSECMVIEDSLNGVRAGRAAGCRVIGLTTSFTAEKLLAAGAEYAFDTFREIESLLELPAEQTA